MFRFFLFAFSMLFLLYLWEEVMMTTSKSRLTLVGQPKSEEGGIVITGKTAILHIVILGSKPNISKKKNQKKVNIN